MAGLQGCASHGGIIQSRDWLPKVEACGSSRHPTVLLKVMQLLMTSRMYCLFYELITGLSCELES